MKKPLVNAAFIDGNNVHLSTLEMGWKLDTRKFKRYLEEMYGVDKAYYCMGFVEYNQGLYDRLESEGYEMVYRKTFAVNCVLKGNIGSELVLKSMTQYRVYKEAIIVASDGDYACLAEYLIRKGKLRSVIASKREKCSHLLEEASRTYICYLDDLRRRLEYHNY